MDYSKFIFIWIVGLTFGIVIGLGILAFGDKISSPPPLPTEPVAEQAYLQQIYDNFHRLEVVTTNPDGARSGKKGDAVFLQTGGNSYLEINSDSSTTWLGVQLTNTP